MLFAISRNPNHNYLIEFMWSLFAKGFPSFVCLSKQSINGWKQPKKDLFSSNDIIFPLSFSGSTLNESFVDNRSRGQIQNSVVVKVVTNGPRSSWLFSTRLRWSRCLPIWRRTDLQFLHTNDFIGLLTDSLLVLGNNSSLLEILVKNVD